MHSLTVGDWTIHFNSDMSGLVHLDHLDRDGEVVLDVHLKIPGELFLAYAEKYILQSLREHMEPMVATAKIHGPRAFRIHHDGSGMYLVDGVGYHFARVDSHEHGAHIVATGPAAILELRKAMGRET